MMGYIRTHRWGGVIMGYMYLRTHVGGCMVGYDAVDGGSTLNQHCLNGACLTNNYSSWGIFFDDIQADIRHLLTFF